MMIDPWIAILTTSFAFVNGASPSPSAPPRLANLEAPLAAKVALEQSQRLVAETHDEYTDLVMREESTARIVFHERVLDRSAEGRCTTVRRTYEVAEKTANGEIDDYGLDGAIANFAVVEGQRRVSLDGGRKTEHRTLQWVLETGSVDGMTVLLEPAPADPDHYLVSIAPLVHLLLLDAGPVSCPKQPLAVVTADSNDTTLVLSGPYSFSTATLENTFSALEVTGDCRIEIDVAAKRLRALTYEAKLAATSDNRMRRHLSGSISARIEITPEAVAEPTDEDAAPPPVPKFRLSRYRPPQTGISVDLPSHYFHSESSAAGEEKYMRGLDTRIDLPFIGFQRYSRRSPEGAVSLDDVEAELKSQFKDLAFTDAKSGLGRVRRCGIENNGQKFLIDFHLAPDGAIFRTRLVAKPEMFSVVLPEYEAAIASLKRG